MTQFFRLRAALAAFCLTAAPLLFLPPTHADTALATSGSYALTQSEENTVLAVWQIIAGRPLAPADRQAIQSVDISLFRHDPAWLLDNIKQTRKVLPRLQGGDAAVKANLRQVNLIDIYCNPRALHMTAAEAAGMQAAIAHYVPVIGVDAASGTVITRRDVDAVVAASHLLAVKSGVPVQDAGLRADLTKLARNPVQLGPKVSADMTGMECDWAAFQLTWPKEPASYQAQKLGRVVPSVRQATARGRERTGLAVAALVLATDQYGEYPYALDPRLAAYKRASDARMARFRIRMQGYMLLNGARNMHNFARKMNGQGPDPQDYYNPIPLPTP